MGSKIISPFFPHPLCCHKKSVALKKDRVIEEYDNMACLEMAKELTCYSSITPRRSSAQKKSTITFKEPIKYVFFLLHQFVKQLAGFGLRDFFIESMLFGWYRDCYKVQHFSYEFFGFAG
jgi:hypothetical protein